MSPLASVLLASLLAANSPMSQLAAGATSPSTAEPEVVVSPGTALTPTLNDEPAPSVPPSPAPVPSGSASAATPNHQAIPSVPPHGVPTPAGHPHRLLIIPFFGVQSISPMLDQFTVNEPGTFGNGLRLGVLAGGWITRWLSLNAGISIDFRSESTDSQGYHGTLTESLLTFNPLVRIGPDAWPILLGPKLGLLWGTESNGPSELDWFGLTYGAELGAFIRVAPAVSVGAVVGIDFMRPWTRTCDLCGRYWTLTGYPPSHYVESASLALLF